MIYKMKVNSSSSEHYDCTDNSTFTQRKVNVKYCYSDSYIDLLISKNKIKLCEDIKRINLDS